jgi:hypothetical protein
MITKFERMLIDNGYKKYQFNGKNMKFELATDHVISTMGNIDHHYIHKSNTNALQKIEKGLAVSGEFGDFTFEDRKGEICFGLHESGKPPTLISPRPRIEVKRINQGNIEIENEYYDESMNVVLANIPHDEILKAKFDHSIVLKIDLT